MRGVALIIAALTVSIAPAEAKWQYFACMSDSFATQFPDRPRIENSKFAMRRHGEALSARKYTATVDGIEYAMLVADYSDRIAFSGSILMEALGQHTGSEDGMRPKGKIILNDLARIEPEERGAVFGRRITMDLLNNGGRSITNLYFYNGKLYEQSVTISPSNGDYTSPYSARFLESLLFNLTRLKEEAGDDAAVISECGKDVPQFVQ
jgi:hypothetical protein